MFCLVKPTWSRQAYSVSTSRLGLDKSTRFPQGLRNACLPFVLCLLEKKGRKRATAGSAGRRNITSRTQGRCRTSRKAPPNVTKIQYRNIWELAQGSRKSIRKCKIAVTALRKASQQNVWKSLENFNTVLGPPKPSPDAPGTLQNRARGPPKSSPEPSKTPFLKDI